MWALILINNVHIRRLSGERHTLTKEPCEGGNRGGSNAVTSQAMLRLPVTTRKSEEAGKDSSLEPSEGAWLC